ncbi:M48 family metalloprotease [Archangium violaceum]|uniref:M56 family metallopeptidase n=1 Tax=Archangium violaceum TaxID=83451 RepID=UPI0019503424|nr:M56 family metallopeptidase [Archangium violaceum]QRN97124.1 M48 family metalloprotease [Archangium violaceum]
MSGAVSQSLGWALLHLVWQGALVAAALAVALRVLDRRAASLRYLLACGALALMLVLPALTGWYHYASYQETESLPAAPAPVPAATVRVDPAPMVTHAVVPTPEAARATEPSPVLERVLAPLGEHMHWLVLAWSLGVAVSSLRLLSGWLKLRRLVREAEPAPAEWQETLERLARRLDMTRPVRLLRSAALDVPAAVGWLRPVVLLPVSALTGLSARQLEMVLAHELAHIRRYDYAVNLVQTLVETLFFYHPAVAWMSRVIRVEREHCCDDIAVGTSGNAVSYARALTALESLRVMPLQAASPAMSALGGSLTERVRRLVVAPAARCSSRWVAGASVLTLMSGVAVAAPLAALILPEHPSAVSEAPAAPVPASAPLPSLGVVPPLPALSAPGASALASIVTPIVGGVVEAVLAQAPVPPAPVPVPKPAPAAKPAPGLRGGDVDVDVDVPDVDEDTTRVDERLSVDQLIGLKVAGITPERVKELESLGYEPTVGNLVQFGHAHVTPEYVKEMTGALGRKPSAEELVEMKHLGVSPERVKALEAAGYGKLSGDELTQAAALGVDAGFINELKAAGYDKLPFDDLVQLRALGVKGPYVQALKDEGYDKLPVEDLVQFKALGVSPEYLRSLRESGLDKLPADDVVQLRALGVSADFIRKLRDEGLEKLSVDELVRLRASGVDADFIRELRKKK